MAIIRRAFGRSWNRRNTSASSYRRFSPRTILQNAGCGRTKGPSRNWISENVRNAPIQAYIPLTYIHNKHVEVQIMGIIIEKTDRRCLSTPSSMTSLVIATYASAHMAIAREVRVVGLKKNSTLVSLVCANGTILHRFPVSARINMIHNPNDNKLRIRLGAISLRC